MHETDRYREVDEVFRAALRVPAEGRTAFLEERCGTSAELRAEVDALLAEDARPRGALDAPVMGEELRLSRLAPDAARAPEAVPDRIGRYRIISRIGEGGMGTVYEAEQESPRRTVAVKVIAHGLATPGMLRRFEVEAQLLGRLQHPGIAQIYEAGVHESAGEAGGLAGGRGARPYFAMEMIRGQPLLKFAEERALGASQRLRLIASVADAVHHAHQRGVIHRDLKPGNILVDDTGRPRVLDFGVARAVDADVQVTTAQTSAGQLVGTVSYMSPEQAAGDPHELDTRSDVYALGVVAYELLAGRLPYEVAGKSLHEAVRIIREREPTPISAVSRLLRGDVQTILGKALEKDKSRRYDSAAALAEDIRRYLSNQPIAARPPSAAYQFRKFARRHRAIVAAAALLFVGLAAAAVFSAVQASRAEAARALADEEAKRAVRRFNDLRTLSKVLIFDVHDTIQDLPGATPARERIVAEGLKYLDALAEEAGGDHDLMHETIQGYTRVAEILGNPGGSSLGKFPEALAAYQRGLALVAKLPAPTTERQAGANAYAASRLHSDLANLLKYLGRGEEALEHARAAAAVARPFKDFHHSLAGALATSLAREVQILTWMGKPREALDVFREVYAIDEAILKSVPEQQKYSARRNLISDNIKLGDMHRQVSEYPEAIEYYRKALAMAAEMLAAGQSGVRRLRNVAQQGLGKSLHLAGDLGAALVQLEAVRDDARAIVEEDPGNIRPLQDFLVAVEGLGDAEAELGHDDRALALFREQIEAARQLADRTPENVDHTLSIGFGHQRVGDVLVKLGRTDEAIQEYAQALEHALAVRGKDQSIGVAHEIEVVVNRRLGELWLERSAGPGTEEARRAEAHLRAAVDAIKEMESRSITARHKDVDPRAITELLERTARPANPAR